MMASTVQETAHASLSFGGTDTEKKIRHGEQGKTGLPYKARQPRREKKRFRKAEKFTQRRSRTK